MRTYLAAFFISLLASLALTPAARGLAHRFKLFDDPSETRKVHTTQIPRIGGVAIAVSFFLPVIALFFYDNNISDAYLSHTGQVLGLFLGAFSMVALGLLDDLKNLRARHKLVVQIGAALFAYGCGYHIDAISNPFGASLELGLLGFPITMLWIVGIINAINFIDGLDGLAGGISLFSVVTLFVIAVIGDKPIVALTTVALAGSLLGFLRYNFNPASIFMGDSGSMFLGFVLAVTSISGSAKSSTVVAVLIPALALGVPLFDTVATVLRRLIAGRPLFSADRAHIHHRLLDLGLSHRQAVLVLYATCLVLTGTALTLQYTSSLESGIILAIVGFAAVAFGRWVGYLSFQDLGQQFVYGFRRQRRLNDNLSAIWDIGRGMRTCNSPLELRAKLQEVMDEVHIDFVECRLTVTTPDGTKRFAFELPEPTDTTGELLQPIFRSEHSLDWSIGGHVVTGHLAFCWFCQEENLRLPEVACFNWLAVVFRDRMLELVDAPQPLRLVEPEPSEASR